MKHSFIEPLEARIAPAGVVTLSIVGATLKVVGDDAANVFNVTQLSDGSVRFDALSNTQLRVGDNLQMQAQFTSAEGRSMSFELFAGSDEVIIAGLSLGKDLKVDAGAGDDVLSFEDIQVDGKLEIKGGAGNNTVNLAGLMEEEGIFYFLGGPDSDTLNMDAATFSAASFKADFGGGADFMDYTDDAAMDSFTVAGKMEVLMGAGDDSARFHARSASIGSLKLDMGAGINAVVWDDATGHFDFLGKVEVLGANTTAAFSFGSVTLGSLAVNLTGSSDAFSMTAVDDLTIRKGTTVNLAADGKVGDITMAARGSLTMPGVVSMKFGGPAADGAQTHSLNIGARDARLGGFFCLPEVGDEVLVAFAGYDPATGFDAANPARTLQMAAMNMQFLAGLTMNSTDIITVRGSATLKSAPGADAGARVVSITAGGVDIGEDLLFTDGAGDAEFTLVADSISIGGKLALNLGDTATHEIVNLGLPGGTLTAASVSVLSRTETVDNNETITIAVAGRVETTGAFTIVDGAGALDAQFADVDLDIGKGFTLALGSGDADVSLQGNTFTAGGPVIIGSSSLPGDVETVSSIWNFHVWVDAIVKMGAGASSFTHEADTGIARNVSLDLGAGANNAHIESNGGLRIGKLTHKSKAGAAALFDRFSVEGVVAKEISAFFDEADAIFGIRNSRIGKLTANLGGGADRVRLDDNTITGDTAISTGAGADAIEVENDETHWVGHDFFLGRVTFDLGAGDDDVSIASAAAETKASFFGTVTVNGGEGADTFTPHATNATFAIAPVLTSIP